MFMKVHRNDPCYCGSGKKFKHCCGKGGDINVDPYQQQKSVLIKTITALFIGFIIYSFVNWMQTGVEMELYKCDNPNCDQWHQRPKKENP